MSLYDYKEVLKKYTYPGDKEIIERISKCSGTDERENRDIINSIVLWKVNRQVNIGNVFQEILDLKMSGYNDFCNKEQKVRAVVANLLNVKGVRIAMASTILRMFYPEVFPIIDQRAYRELYSIEMPSYAKPEEWVESYITYVKDCHEYYNKNCIGQIDFADLDKVLFQIDKDKPGNKNLKGYGAKNI